LIVDYQFDPLFDDSRDIAMATNFMVKIGKNWTIYLYSYPWHS